MVYQFAITGCGKIAQRHAKQAAQFGRLVAVCDVVPERADELAAQYGARAYYDYATMLANEKGLDIISICTPNGLHAAQSIAADGMAMNEAARASGKKLFVVKSSRYNPVIAELKRIAASGQLGKIHSFQLNCVWNRPAAYYSNSWKGTTLLDGGTLYTQFSHYTDVLLWLLGDAKDVTGFRTNSGHPHIIEFEDTGAIAVQLQSGAIGTIHYSVNAIHKNQEVSLTIVAESGTIKLAGEYMNELVYQEPMLIDTATLEKANEANDYGFYKGSMSNHDKVYENLIKTLDGIEGTVTDGEGALKTVTFIERIYQQVKL
jgi:UDP-N-acetyl-2-amino-2-deoxyglucuronate dehydrogenase